MLYNSFKCFRTVAILATIAAILLVSSCYVLFYNDMPNKIDFDSENKSNEPESRTMGECHNASSCIVDCKNVEGTTILTEAIERSLESIKACRTIALQLQFIKFDDEKIKKGWLSNLSKNVDKLSIIHSFLTTIETDFSDHPFRTLVEITLGNTDVRTLTKEVFDTMTSVNIIEIWSDSLTNVNFDANLFGGLVRFLHTLQIQRCLHGPSALDQITGPESQPLTGLAELDLRYNDLQKITRSSFEALPYVERIYLQECGILEIEAEAFRPNLQLQELQLSGNKLVTLPEGLFQFQPKISITISGNLWRCDCRLIWLKQGVTDGAITLIDQFKCFGDVDFSQVDFCPKAHDDTSTTHVNVGAPTVTVPVTTEQPANEDDDDDESKLVVIKCHQAQLADNNTELSVHSTIKVRNDSITVTFRQMSETAYFILDLSFANGIVNLSNQNLLWINSRERSCAGCLNDLKTGILIENLTHGETYTFCFIKEKETGVSPFDCFGLTVPQEWNARTWIPNEAKPGVISGICAGLMIIAAISGLLIFYCVRQHPTMIKGNKRVILVESKVADAIVMPKSFKSPPSPTSLKSGSDGYLTPKEYEHFEDVAFRNGTLSTIFEGTPPSRTKLRKSRIRRRVRLEEQTFDYHFYEPPPLPPNHPVFGNCTNK